MTHVGIRVHCGENSIFSLLHFLKSFWILFLIWKNTFPFSQSQVSSLHATSLARGNRAAQHPDTIVPIQDNLKADIAEIFLKGIQRPGEEKIVSAAFFIFVSHKKSLPEEFPGNTLKLIFFSRTPDIPAFRHRAHVAVISLQHRFFER